MNDNKMWKVLRDIEIDRVKRNHDFEQINERLNQKVFHWQIPAVAISIVCIIFFLIASMPTRNNEQNYAQEEKHVVKILLMQGEGNPQSKWQLSVHETTDSEKLKEVGQQFAELLPMEQPIGEREVEGTFKFVYSDESVVLWEAIRLGNTLTYFDVKNGQYYKPTGDLEYVYMFMSDLKENPFMQPHLVLLLLVTIVMLIQFYISKKIKQTTSEHGKDKRYSTNWQMVVNLALVALLLLCFYLFQPLHFAVTVVLIVLSFLGNIWLENKYGRNNWRKLNFVVDAIYQLVLVYFVFVILV